MDTNDVDSIEDKEVADRWPGLKTLVEVTSIVDYGDHTAISVRRYISDEDFPKASYFNLLARGHWAIEKQLHWCLDEIFKEDASRARKKYIHRNLSVIQKLSLQIIKCMYDKSSLKKRRFKASLSPDYFIQLILKTKI